jgi:ribosome modulation factor
MGLQSAYWVDGWHAYVDGKSTDRCPYSEGSAREDWLRGYKDAMTALAKL